MSKLEALEQAIPTCLAQPASQAVGLSCEVLLPAARPRESFNLVGASRTLAYMAGQCLWTAPTLSD